MRPKTSLNGEENSLPIPIDLVVDIFSRLPAKSVAKCRCVSKLWASTLRRPDFTELFLTRSLASPQLLIAYQNSGEFFFFSSPQPQNLDENSSSLVANYHMKLSFYESCRMSGLVHGLVCFMEQRYSKGCMETLPVICNLGTGQSLPLPKVNTRRINVRSILGYDPIEKQFKVLSMTWPNFGREMMCEEHQVLTLGTGKLSWRKIECSIPPHSVWETGICINGCLYYQAEVNGFSKVICFDVRSEKFRIINKDKGMKLWCVSTLVNYKGKLGAIEVSDNGFPGVTGKSRYLALWVLVNAEKHEWLKHIYVFPPLWKNVVANAKLFFVGVTGTNEIVLSSYTSGPFCVFYYNIERNTVRRVEMQGMDAYENHRVDIFLDHVEDVKLIQMFRT